MILTIKLYLLLLSGPLDWLRGSDIRWCPTLVRSLAYGFGLAILLGSSHLWTWPVFAVLWAVGEAPGWGEPVGAILDRRPMRPGHLERWQVGPLKTNSWLAVTARGAIWAAPPALLALVDPVYLASLGLLLIFPATLMLDRRKTLLTWNWQEWELLRGWSMGVVALTAWLVL